MDPTNFWRDEKVSNRIVLCVFRFFNTSAINTLNAIAKYRQIDKKVLVAGTTSRIPLEVVEELIAFKKELQRRGERADRKGSEGKGEEGM